MRNRASIAPVFASPRAAASPSWGERLMLRIMGIPMPDEVEERMRNYRGFFARLTPEQIAAMDAYDGPEVLGPANGPRRKL